MNVNVILIGIVPPRQLLKVTESLVESKHLNFSFSNTLSCAHNSTRIITLQKKLKLHHLTLLKVDKKYRALVEVYTVYTLNINGMRQLRQRISTVFDDIFSVSCYFHNAIMTNENMEAILGKIQLSISEVSRKYDLLQKQVITQKVFIDTRLDTATLMIQRHVRGLLGRIYARQMIFDRMAQEQILEENAAGIRIQQLVRLRKAKKILSKLLSDRLCVEAKHAHLYRSTGRNPSGLWKRICKKYAMMHMYQHVISHRVQVKKPDDYEEPLYRFPAWRLVKIETDSDTNFKGLTKKEFYLDIWTGDRFETPIYFAFNFDLSGITKTRIRTLLFFFCRVWKCPAEFNVAYSCCAKSNWQLIWKQRSDEFLYIRKSSEGSNAFYVRQIIFPKNEMTTC